MTQDEVIENLTKLVELQTKSEEVAIKMIEAAILTEREACAKVCAQLMTPWDENTPNGELIALRNDGMRQCAAAIRARSEK